MAAPILAKYGREEIYIHEPGCSCGLDHDGLFQKQADGKAAYLTLRDPRTNLRYHQVWYRSGKWTLAEAMDMLIQRKSKQEGGRAA